MPTPPSTAECPDAPNMTVREQRIAAEDARRDVLQGLSQRPRRLPCRLLYDERGARLFDRICELPEYYPTRTEMEILRTHGDDIAEALGRDCRVIEFGSGSSTKTRLLLDALDRPAGYVPIDVSRAHLIRSAAALAADYPHLDVQPLVADFTRPMSLPAPSRETRSTCAFFPGSTLGNFESSAAAAFLRRIARMLGVGGALLIGIDLQKDVAVIERAYNDAAGVTAAFSLNILSVINRAVGADFDPDLFEHRAVYDPVANRVEIRLVSLVAQKRQVAGEKFTFEPGEFIVTEYSHKYTIEGFTRFARDAGFGLERAWTDPRRYFAVLLLRVAEAPGR